MNQVAFEFAKPVQVPPADTQLGKLLRALQRGEKLTVAEALTRYQVYALSQRMGNLRSMGWPVLSQTIITEGGARVSRYYMVQR